MMRRNYTSALAEAVRRRNLWILVALLLGVSNLLLAGGLLSRLGVAEKTIVTPPEIRKPFSVQGEEVSPEYLEQMAPWFAGLALTYNPDNIDYQIRQFLSYADPRAYGELAARLESDAEKVRRNQMSSVFHAREVRIRGRQVAVTGTLMTLVASKSTGQREATFLIEFNYRSGRLTVRRFLEVQSDDPFAAGAVVAGRRS